MADGSLQNSVIYLINCLSNPSSEIDFYSERANSASGANLPPDSLSTVSSGSYVTWESGTIRVADPFHLFLNMGTDSATQSFGTKVGQARLRLVGSQIPPGQPPSAIFYAVYDIFRDDDRVVYTDATKGDCASIYWCWPSGAIEGVN